MTINTLAAAGDTIIATLLSLLLWTQKIIGVKKLATFADLISMKKLAMTINTLAAAGDTIIATLLSLLLWTQKKGLEGTNRMINGMACTTPHSFISIFFFFNMGSLYTNTFLVTLNIRSVFREIGNNSNGSSLTLPTFGTGTVDG
ncbi:hypothetical protein K435DRAFT_811117 [Dendrothele bispora CBS 962.96]|uniref:DUF6534 domain-containing protein n=1 Tax=Dendrothele bispora (strain CBS 962.96) TaxID=1314807 RepID=A0A4S8KT89_DENBC|nr:hypothetical protein K435DRAFT_811117 [Dendrothele bispora CBS 962.96]